MSAFSAYSESPFAVSEVRLDANAFMLSATATTTAGTIDTIHLTTNPVSPAVTATTTSGTLQVNVTENLDSVSAATASGTLALDAQAFTTLSAVTASTVTTALDDVDAQATITPSAATSTGTAGTIDTIHLTAAITLGGVALVLTPSSPSPHVDENLVSVSAATAAGTLSATGLANTILANAAATSTAGVAGFDAKANITLDAATADADLTVNNLEDEDAQASTTLAGVSAASTANWDTVNGIYAIQITFLNTDFARERTVNVVKYGNYTAYITK